MRWWRAWVVMAGVVVVGRGGEEASAAVVVISLSVSLRLVAGNHIGDEGASKLVHTLPLACMNSNPCISLAKSIRNW